MNETVYKILLYTHIATGFLALLTGAISLSTPKGGNIHKPSGRIFFYAMICVAISAFIIAIAKDLKFLLAVSIFSFYMNFTGFRALRNKTGRFEWYDWLALVVSLFCVLYMFISLNRVLLVFGAILTLFIVRDIMRQMKNDDELKIAQRGKVLHHISRMVGTYIATATAFLVVNTNFVKLWWLPWLLPTFVGTPIIIYYSKQWRKKLKLT